MILFQWNIFNEFSVRLMPEETQSPTTSDPPNISNNEIKTSNPSKKHELQKENTLYIEPLPKFYLGVGNNSEL